MVACGAQERLQAGLGPCGANGQGGARDGWMVGADDDRPATVGGLRCGPTTAAAALSEPS
jgi:hypothetical protein